ncbi:uncharacterized protein BJ171DRAFT_585255 [Polychytrium aggregatum]|uniref:uncharacterized protein n=1 Tax=Polychytrium aggregatum TaxID=110093 RepID=UPI0022FE9A92|nr:uncharacterized protein BJ171DRAFT_585255 [Polychytrium aggregatum]KAI9199460.1 hypothetical protein BJ171DRAFT_585255 [Polychytrium aggregatum]
MNASASVASDEAAIVALLADPLLADVKISLEPSQALQSIAALEDLIAIERNEAFTVRVDRSPLEPIDLVVRPSTTLADLKRQFQTKLGSLLSDSMASTTSASDCPVETPRRATRPSGPISWRYTWRSYLFYSKRLGKLQDDHQNLIAWGLQSGDELRFMKKLRMRKAKAKKR